jgi:predicted outer membrane repeat protein
MGGEGAITNLTTMSRSAAKLRIPDNPPIRSDMMSPHIFLALALAGIAPVAASANPVSIELAAPYQQSAPIDPAGGTLAVTVGSDAACDYPNITQAALLSPLGSFLLIRVARNVVIPGPQVIPGRPISIVGGYDTCSDGSPSGYTVLDGSRFAGSVLWATSAYSGSTVYPLYLVVLDIRGGNGSGSARGGGMTVEGPFAVQLFDTRVQNNTTAFEGGGIYLKGQAGTATGSDLTSLSLDGDTVISNNNANSGGGIACAGRVRIESRNTQIAVNVAAAYGGGIHSNGCFVILRGHGLAQGVIFNQAGASVGRGGGVYSINGNVAIRGESRNSSVVVSNTSAYGGGLYVEASTLLAYDATINNNTGYARGGGVYAFNSETIIGRTLRGAGCHHPLRCSELSGNSVVENTPGSGGGGLWASSGTTRISSTFIELNRVSAGRGAAVLVVNAIGSSGGTALDGLRIFNSVIAGNTANGQAVAADASIVQLQTSSAALGFNTFARNVEVPRIVYTPTSGPTFYPVDIYGSIFDATSGLAADPGTSGSVPGGDCNRLHESTSPFAQSSSRSTTAVPQFVDAANRDFALAATSFLIDWCDSSYGYSSFMSANGGIVGYDDPTWPALYGNYDLGALERQPVDLIFRDDFEN